MKRQIDYCMFEDRHILPKNRGAIYKKYTWSTKRLVKTHQWEESLYNVKMGNTIRLYVTGLTPVLVEFIKEYIKIKIQNIKDDQPYGDLILLHHNKLTKKYEEQYV